MVITPNYDLDTDTTLGGSNASDYVIPSQKAIKSYVDNNTGSTVDQTFDPTSQAAQSGVAIAGAGFLTSIPSGYLQNTATGTGALTLLGTATNKQNAINIGTNSSATNDATVVIGADAKSGYTNSVAIGYKADANDTQSIAIGHSAKTNYSQAVAIGSSSQATASASVAIGGSSKASANTANAFGYSSEATGVGATTLGYSAKASAVYSIQLGKGTNSTASSLAVGFNGTNYSLLDGTTGLIPDARISTNIARTSAIPTVNNPTITFTQGGTTKGTITLNQSTNQTIAFDAGGGGGTVDQTYDGTSTNAQSGVAIAGELANYVLSGNSDAFIYNNGASVNCGYADDDYVAELYIDDASAELVFDDSQNDYHSGVTVSPEGVMLFYNYLGVGIQDRSNDDTVVLTVSNGSLAVNGSEVALQSDIPDISTKQDTLVSGTNIKTINNTSILGSGNIDTSEILVADLSTDYTKISTAIFNNKPTFLISGGQWYIYERQLSNGSYRFVSPSSYGYTLLCDVNQNQNLETTHDFGDCRTAYDGQWFVSETTIINDVSPNGSTDVEYSLASYLPDDNYNYEVLFSGIGETDSTSGHQCALYVKSDIITGTLNLGRIVTRSSATRRFACSNIIPIGTGRKIKLLRSSSYYGKVTLIAEAYRRIGTNTQEDRCIIFLQKITN